MLVAQPGKPKVFAHFWVFWYFIIAKVFEEQICRCDRACTAIPEMIDGHFVLACLPTEPATSASGTVGVRILSTDFTFMPVVVLCLCGKTVCARTIYRCFPCMDGQLPLVVNSAILTLLLLYQKFQHCYHG